MIVEYDPTILLSNILDSKPIQPLKIFFQLLWKIYKEALHKKRNVFTLSINFIINFSPVFIWLCIFKNAKYIPNKIRPAIHGKVAFYSDLFLFGDYWHEFETQLNTSYFTILSYYSSTVFFVVVLTLIPIIMWWYIYYYRMRYVNKKNVSTDSPLHHILNWHTPFDKKTPKSTLLPFLILPISFVLLNIDHYFADQRQNFTVFKDYLGWVFYVVIHLAAPILTAVYLYVFQAPGTVKCFSIALGLQNCCSVLTHLLIPMAPPWFTHLYGINDATHLNYETKGYAAGLVRVDLHLGTHLTSNGFHKSPIVFGAVPSVHSAMAFQCFLFVMTQSKQGWGVTVWSPLRNISSNRLLLLNGKKDDDCEINTFELNNSDGSDSIDLYNTEEDEYERSIYSEQSLSSALENDSINNASCDLISKYNMTPLPDLTNSNKFTKFIYWLIKNSVISRFLVCVFLLLQWWATMYVDHHYRFDLFIGELYALVSFYLVNRFILQKKVIPNFLRKRENREVYDEDEDDGENKTMGMRVFGDTKIGWVFDPLYS